MKQLLLIFLTGQQYLKENKLESSLSEEYIDIQNNDGNKLKVNEDNMNDSFILEDSAINILNTDEEVNIDNKYFRGLAVM